MTLFLTFNQLLYLKSMSIKEQQGKSSTLKKIALRIGGFHRMISFLSSVEYIIQGSGLKVLLELLYPEGSVITMLDGKEVTTVTGSHTLIYIVLYGYLTANLFECN